mmetsp:Transcript_65532/g.188918  ORF Transcript_65532/g.188918 Transcript_65532/m.188918 type:complete len:853 (+) Transcript_65532:179-2737(+)
MAAPPLSLEIEACPTSSGRSRQPLHGAEKVAKATRSWSPDWFQDSAMGSFSSGGSLAQMKSCVEVAVDWVQWLPMQVAALVLFVTPQALFFGLPLVYQVFSPRTLRECVDDYKRRDTIDHLFPCNWILWDGKDELAICTLLGMLLYLAAAAAVAGCRGSDLSLFLLYILWCFLFVISGMWRQEFVLMQDMCWAMQLVTLIIEFGILAVYWMRLCAVVVAMRTFSKHMASKQKQRFVDTTEGFDLDLSYITPRIIAMGWPSNSMLEAQLRNSMAEVKRFLRIRHGGCYKVYNLCIERSYPSGSFEKEFGDIRFPDHNPCALEDIDLICRDMQDFLDASRSNVVVVHCKAGKGRTGLIVSSLLLRLQVAQTAQEALTKFAARRTRDGKGVTIPSQIRYVQHYETVLAEGKLRQRRWLRLAQVDIFGQEDSREGWHLQLISHEDGMIFSSVAGSAAPPPMFDGDIKLVVFCCDRKVFQVWLNTAYDVERVTPGDAGDMSCRPIWVDPAAPSEAGADFVLRLPATLLDGPHKAKGATARAKWGIRLLFQTPSLEQVDAFRAAKRRSRRTICQQPRALAGSEDYDALSDDTDMEVILTTRCQGYLSRRRHACSRGSKRWCSLHVSGALTIAGSQDSNSDVCLVNVVLEHSSANFQQIGPMEWRVKNHCSGGWEILEAPAEQAEQWLRAFADARRLGEALDDQSMAFAGLFWKAGSRASLHFFDVADWDMTVLLLRRDGSLSYYSWHESLDIHLCTLSYGEDMKMQLLRPQWRSMAGLVPFEVHRSGEATTLFAASPPLVDRLFSASEQLYLRPRSRSESSQPRIRLAVSSVAALMGFHAQEMSQPRAGRRTRTSSSY